MPRPQKRNKETWMDYVRRLIEHYIKEGYPRKQAIAIAYKVAEEVKRNQMKRYRFRLLR